MAFEQKTWTDRLSEYPTRRQLTKSDGSTEIVDVARLEGTISQEGDAFSAEKMNDLEQRIADEFSELNNAFATVKKNYQGNSDVSLILNDSHMQVVNQANNEFRPIYASDFVLYGNFSLREHTPYCVGSIIVNCTDGEVNVAFSTLGISSKPSIVMAQLQSEQGFVVYDYDGSSQFVRLVLLTRYKDENGIRTNEIVPAPNGSYRVGVIIYA